MSPHRPRLRMLLMIGVIAGLAACAGKSKPYVYIPDEFDRSRADFGKEPKDRTDLKICYNSFSTTPDELLAFAQAECGKYKKKAVFQDEDWLQCSLTYPVRAHYTCVAEQSKPATH